MYRPGHAEAKRPSWPGWKLSEVAGTVTQCAPNRPLGVSTMHSPCTAAGPCARLFHNACTFPAGAHRSLHGHRALHSQLDLELDTYSHVPDGLLHRLSVAPTVKQPPQTRRSPCLGETEQETRPASVLHARVRNVDPVDERPPRDLSAPAWPRPALHRTHTHTAAGHAFLSHALSHALRLPRPSRPQEEPPPPSHRSHHKQGHTRPYRAFLPHAHSALD
ncbi:hypothetical protein HETIRDRAFT_105563 [Heterobasidion irregulare TC 32-1]|uniref:Uncharacterized protein n=1 Tax=Heterobasidion irregulare (strain TC 32-1) TaxID=747525 RepID=W4JUS7_HETIT|nr:uncharacterized protein HETIRDRAFT_105563 [Heterobasidion irregulare TC 32-1]ETW77282.1 hypothetical protein HETIRDRAFT_105563 [Heterobasidion irregulare TC 32-1]